MKHEITAGQIRNANKRRAQKDILDAARKAHCTGGSLGLSARGAVGIYDYERARDAHSELARQSHIDNRKSERLPG
jgi:hypothetical protein